MLCILGALACLVTKSEMATGSGERARLIVFLLLANRSCPKHDDHDVFPALKSLPTHAVHESKAFEICFSYCGDTVAEGWL